MKKHFYSLAGAGFLLLCLVYPCSANPSLPPTNSPPPKAVWTNEFPPFTPPPPPISKYSFYDENGMMFDISKDDLIFGIYHYDYVLEACDDLAEGSWYSVTNITGGVYHTGDLFKDDDSRFFRVKKRKQPHPPYGMWSRSSKPSAVSSRPNKGGFNKK